jgi:hypothetical protein
MICRGIRGDSEHISLFQSSSCVFFPRLLNELLFPFYFSDQENLVSFRQVENFYAGGPRTRSLPEVSYAFSVPLVVLGEKEKPPFVIILSARE